MLKKKALCAALLSVFAAGAVAQTAPDAGRILRQELPAPEAPRPAEITVDVPKPAATPPGGAQVVLQSVSIEGNTVFTEEQLLAVLGEVRDRSFDLAQLRELGERVAEHYRRAGYPFARVLLPAQSIDAGVLRMQVVEGRYGQVSATGEAQLAEGGQAFLSRLKPGEVIESSPLERATLILNDQPGIRLMPLVRPGQAFGTGDLEVKVERVERVGGDVGLDNYGNRYTGEFRARANLRVNGPFAFGDQLTVRTLLTDEGMWYGDLGYNAPIGTSGLRGQVGYAHTYYQLGKDFSALDATGTADVTSLGASYPIIRSQPTNLSIALAWQHKELNDRRGAVGTDDGKSSDSLPVTLGFDRRDGLLGGGITYGALSWTGGRLRLDPTLAATDQVTAQTEGRFSRVNLDVARLQSIRGGLSGYARLALQHASKNLDSSEGFGLGGPTGVRAYPVGEAFGDAGHFIQLELRQALGNWEPFTFYDAGEIKVNERPWTAGPNERRIAGTGLGVRLYGRAWTADAALAWRTEGGAPQSDTADRNPRAWVNVAYRF